MDYWTLIEYLGSALGMIGAVTNSFGDRLARVTWPIWLASNLFLVIYTGIRHEWGLFTMQSFYLVTTANGIRRVFLPRVALPRFARIAFLRQPARSSDLQGERL